MKKIVFAALAMCVLGVSAREAAADGMPNPFYQNTSVGNRGLFFRKHPPYDQHFQTPAPLLGAYYAPPYAGGGMVNPYFPVPQVPVAPVQVPPVKIEKK